MSSTTSIFTSSSTATQTLMPDNIMLSPFDQEWDNVEPNEMTTTPFEDEWDEGPDGMVDPNRNDTFVANKSGMVSVENDNCDEEFSYRGFQITRILSVPCLFLMLVSSVLLVYIILKHLRAVLYLYISVLFYALTQVCAVLFDWNYSV